MHRVLDSTRKKRAGKCLTPHCRNAARSQRNFCNTCRGHFYDDPMRRLFRNLKAHAKRRGKEFLLEFDEFASLALSSGYLLMAGREKHCLHVDRIDARRGYEKGNIRIISSGENSRKAYIDKRVLNGLDEYAECGGGILFDLWKSLSLSRPGWVPG